MVAAQVSFSEVPASIASPEMVGHTEPAYGGGSDYLETLLVSFPLSVVAAVAVAQLELEDPVHLFEDDEPAPEETGVRRIAHDHGTVAPRLVSKQDGVSR